MHGSPNRHRLRSSDDSTSTVKGGKKWDVCMCVCVCVCVCVYVCVCLCVSSSLAELEKGIKGLVVMSSSLEETFRYIHDIRVPPLWEKVPDPPLTWKCSRNTSTPTSWVTANCWKHDITGDFSCLSHSLCLTLSAHQAYPSLKPLAAWTRDLCLRVSEFARWAETAQPPNLFWLSSFTLPNGFLTAVLQSSARQYNVSVHTARKMVPLH